MKHGNLVSESDLLGQDEAQRQHAKSALGAQALSAWRLYRLRAVWATWAKRAADKAARRGQLSKVVQQWRNRALAKAFLPWLAGVMRTHDLQDLLASYLGKQVHCSESSLGCPGSPVKLLLCSNCKCTSKGRASQTGSSGKARHGRSGGATPNGQI